MTVTEAVEKNLRERRNLVSLFMVTALLGLALQETIGPVRDTIRADGVTLGSVALFVVFFLTLFRFYVGNILHLQSAELTNTSSGFRWIFDLFVIMAECVIMIFMAGSVTIDENAAARFGFFDLIVLLFLVDVGWVILIWLLAVASRLPLPVRIKAALGRKYVPYRWAILNSIVAAYIIVSGFLVEDRIFSQLELGILVAVNVVAFILDVMVFDYDDLF